MTLCKMNRLPEGYSLRVASESDFAAVRTFYDCLIDDLLQQPYHPLWDKKGHPADSYLQAALKAGELWVVEYEAGIVAALVVNHAANDGYLAVPWRVQTPREKAAVIHAFGVSTRHQGKGLGAAVMQRVIEFCRAAGDKAIRLDLIDFNLPVQRAYLKMGFVKCAEIKLHYEEVGWQLFHMYELAL